jgi:hypothetical protein
MDFNIGFGTGTTFSWVGGGLTATTGYVLLMVIGFISVRERNREKQRKSERKGERERERECWGRFDSYYGIRPNDSDKVYGSGLGSGLGLWVFLEGKMRGTLT